jgi:hypothetical protein
MRFLVLRVLSIRLAVDATRNSRLFYAACRLCELEAGGELSQGSSNQTLIEAGLGFGECETTVDSGLKATKTRGAHGDRPSLMGVETEFAATFKVAGSETNTLSPIVRQAWDTGTLRALTRHNPLTARGAHISIVGHITSEELKRHLTSTEANAKQAKKANERTIRASDNTVLRLREHKHVASRRDHEPGHPHPPKRSLRAPNQHHQGDEPQERTHDEQRHKDIGVMTLTALPCIPHSEDRPDRHSGQQRQTHNQPHSSGQTDLTHPHDVMSPGHSRQGGFLGSPSRRDARTGISLPARPGCALYRPLFHGHPGRRRVSSARRLRPTPRLR